MKRSATKMDLFTEGLAIRAMFLQIYLKFSQKAHMVHVASVSD